MRLLKLLDPRGITISGPGMTIAEQALRARHEFPGLVDASALRYWRPSQPIPARGTRFLIGVAPTFSLMDLRFLDIINEALGHSLAPNSMIVNVFDVDDTMQGELLPQYFPIIVRVQATPIVGQWENGQLKGIWTGGDAINEVFKYLGIDISPEQLVRSVRPPSASILDDSNSP